jgi:hypothetical protein
MRLNSEVSWQTQAYLYNDGVISMTAEPKQVNFRLQQHPNDLINRANFSEPAFSMPLM